MGIDPGTGKDPTGIVGIHGRFGQIDVKFAKRLFRPSDSELYQIIANLEQAVRPDVILCETNNQGKSFYQNLLSMGLNVKPAHTTNATNSLKLDVMSKVDTISYILRSQLSFPRNPSPEVQELLNELRNIVRFEGKFRADKHRHDDLFMGLLLAVHCKRCMDPNENDYS